MPLIELRKAFRSSEEIRDRILEFIQEQVLTVSQIAACNRLHESDQRLARWLLMAQDRTESSILNFTQEFLAMMLGAQRTTVTSVAGGLRLLPDRQAASRQSLQASSTRLSYQLTPGVVLCTRRVF